MGGFLGIGKSGEEEELERQNNLKIAEMARARKEADLRLADKKAKKGQEISKIELGSKKTRQEGEEEEEGPRGRVSSSLALGPSKKKTGLQI